MYKTIGILITVAFIIGLLKVLPSRFIQRSESTDAKLSHQVKADTTQADIKISAVSFYIDYDKCIKDPSQTTKTCLKKNINASSQLIPQEALLDPIFCSEGVPDSYSVSNIMTKNNSGQVEVTETISGISQKNMLTLGKEGDKWKVQKVSCPET